MPIFRRISLLNSQEPELYSKLRRGNTVKHGKEDENRCSHDGEISNWKCGKCKKNLGKFELCFDDNEGRVAAQTKVWYENSFLDDFE